MTPASMAEAVTATVALPPRTTTVAMKTLVVTALTVAQKTIINQLKVSNSGRCTSAVHDVSQFSVRYK